MLKDNGERSKSTAAFFQGLEIPEDSKRKMKDDGKNNSIRDVAQKKGEIAGSFVTKLLVCKCNYQTTTQL